MPSKKIIKKQRSRRKAPAPRRVKRVNTFTAPMAVTTIRRQVAPRVGTKRGGLSVTHSILLQVVTGSSTDPFHVNSVGLQPGDPTHLPWLANIARNYETYKVLSISARYIPTCATTTSGRLLFYWEYDVNDSMPTDYVAASAQWRAMATAPWKGVSVPADVRKIHAQFPQKRVTEAFDNDFRSDIASFVVCRTSGTAGPWGEVWLDFTVQFATPTYNTTGNVGIVKVGSQTVYSAPVQVLSATTENKYIPFSPNVEEPEVDDCNLGALSAPTGLVSSTTSGVAGGGAVFLPQGEWGVELVSENFGSATATTSDNRIISYANVVVSDDVTDIRSSPDLVVGSSLVDETISVNTHQSSQTKSNYVYSIVASPQAGVYLSTAMNIYRFVNAVRTVTAGAKLIVTYLGGGSGNYERGVLKNIHLTQRFYAQDGRLREFESRVRRKFPELLPQIEAQMEQSMMPLSVLESKRASIDDADFPPPTSLRRETTIAPIHGVILRSVKSPPGHVRALGRVTSEQ